jgi:hypothetical protein
MLILAALPLSLGAASAQGDQHQQRLRNAMNNVQHEMIECAAYYNIFAACLAVSNYDVKRVDKMRELSNEFLTRGSQLALSIGMTADAMASRFQMAHQNQLNLIKKSCINISSLIYRYQDRCLLILRDFRAVVNEYLKRSLPTGK